MPNVQKYRLIAKADIPPHLSALGQDFRQPWLSMIKAALASGDMRKIEERLKAKGKKVKYNDIDNVLRGKSFNKKYALLVISVALDLIEENKSEKQKNKFIANQSIHNLVCS